LSARLRATPEQLRDALGACTQLHEVHRRLLKMALEELRPMEEQIEQLDREALGLLQDRGWDTARPSGPSPIGFAECLG
jgi:hypothetical protein